MVLEDLAIFVLVAGFFSAYLFPKQMKQAWEKIKEKSKQKGIGKRIKKETKEMVKWKK